MHAMTLQALEPHLKPGGRALDIGTGSGYMAAAMAEIMGENCLVTALDHIEAITKFAESNINKHNDYLMKLGLI